MKERARQRRTDMKGKIDTQTRMDPGASSVLGGGGPGLSARVAEGRNRISAQELSVSEGRVDADLAKKAKARELGAWGQLKDFSPVRSLLTSSRIWWIRDGC